MSGTPLQAKKGFPLFYGKVYGCFIANLIIGAKARIDFVIPANCVFPDSNSIINVPMEAVNNVHIKNVGPANVQYSVNSPNIHEMIGGVLDTITARELRWPYTNIKSINFLTLPTADSAFASIAVDVQK